MTSRIKLLIRYDVMKQNKIVTSKIKTDNEFTEKMTSSSKQVMTSQININNSKKYDVMNQIQMVNSNLEFQNSFIYSNLERFVIGK